MLPVPPTSHVQRITCLLARHVLCPKFQSLRHGGGGRGPLRYHRHLPLGTLPPHPANDATLTIQQVKRSNYVHALRQSPSSFLLGRGDAPILLRGFP